MAEARGREPRHALCRAVGGAELVRTRAGIRSPWNECAFERVAREVDDGGRTI